MKIIKNSILCILAAGIGLAQIGADSGWTFQNPQLTGSILRGVAAPAANTMIAVGDFGTIVRTADASAPFIPVSPLFILYRFRLVAATVLLEAAA